MPVHPTAGSAPNLDRISHLIIPKIRVSYASFESLRPAAAPPPSSSTAAPPPFAFGGRCASAVTALRPPLHLRPPPSCIDLSKLKPGAKRRRDRSVAEHAFHVELQTEFIHNSSSPNTTFIRSGQMRLES